MERPIISFIKGENVRPKPEKEDFRLSEEEIKDKLASGRYSSLKPENLPTSQIGDGKIFIEEL